MYRVYGVEVLDFAVRVSFHCSSFLGLTSYVFRIIL